MVRGWVHTVCRDGVWVTEVEGGESESTVDGEAEREGVIARHRSKDEAVAVGRVRAIEWETVHVIHNPDGTVAGRSDFSVGSRSPLG